MRHGLLARNVAALAAPPRGTRPEVKSLSPEQARRFLVSIASHRLYALFAVAVSCGLRQGEILGLCWSDVDLDQGALRVHQALERLGKGWRLVEPKSVTSRRTITLPHTVVPILRTHRTQQCAQRLAAGARWTEHGFVFTACHGQPLDGCRLNATTKRLLAVAGLPTLPFHSLRHSAATILLVQGVPPPRRDGSSGPFGRAVNARDVLPRRRTTPGRSGKPDGRSPFGRCRGSVSVRVSHRDQAHHRPL